MTCGAEHCPGSRSQVKELALQRAAESAAQQEARLKELQAGSAELEAQVGDLRLFVEVLLAAAPESRPVAEQQAERARLLRELEVRFAGTSPAATPELLQELRVRGVVEGLMVTARHQG